MWWMPFGRRKREREIQEEIDLHVRTAIRDRIERGESAEQARWEVSKEFGNIPLVREATRGVWTWRWRDRLSQDMRFGFRRFARNKMAALALVSMIALGVGTNTAVYTQVSAVLLEELPVDDASRLRFVEWTSPDRQFPTDRLWDRTTDAAGSRVYSGFPYPIYGYIAERTTGFEALACFTLAEVNLGSGRGAERVTTEFVSASYFVALGLDTTIGRSFRPEDAESGQPVAVISHALWQRQFDAIGDVAGTVVSINGSLFEVVGVAPEGFRGLDPSRSTDVYLPMAALQPERIADTTAWDTCRILGRLADGQTTEQARIETQTLLTQAILQDPPGASYETPRVTLSDGSRGLHTLRRAASRTLLILMAAVGIVLLLVCANVGGLLLASFPARRTEIQTRVALGASGVRLVSQFLTESVTLSIAGGVAGLGLAYLFNEFLPYAFALTSLGSIRPSLDGDVLLFSLAATVGSGIAFGSAPALKALRSSRSVRQAFVTNRHGPSKASRIRKTVVTIQVAVSMLLVVGAGLLVRTVSNLQAVPVSVDPDHVLVFRIDPTANGYDESRRQLLYEELLTRIEALPGVISASLSLDGVLAGARMAAYCTPAQRGLNLETRIVSPGYFETWNVPLLRGRDFVWQDRGDSGRVAVIGESTARGLFSGNPVGQSLGFCDEGGPIQETITVIGLVPDSVTMHLRRGMRSAVHLLGEGRDFPRATFGVRTAEDASGVISGVREILASMDPDLPMYDLQTQARVVANNMSQEEFLARNLVLFGLASLLLASIGIYGSLAAWVRQRRVEFGIRMALGASSGEIVRMVGRQIVGPVGVGIAAGLIGALVVTRLVEGVLFEVSPADPGTILAGLLVLVATAVIAALLPARRAVRTDPLRSLRYE